MKIVILNYTGYRSNWGSQATSRGLMQWILNDLFKDRPSSIEIVPYPTVALARSLAAKS